MAPTSARRLRIRRSAARPGTRSTIRSNRSRTADSGSQGNPGGLDWARRVELASVLLASLVAVVGLWYSNLQTRQANEQARDERALTKEGQITDRYTAAVGNLGDDKLDVRLGGIYALERIMQDSPRDHPTIGNVLAAYVRTHSAKPGVKEDVQKGDVPADVHAALTVLTTRETAYDKSFTLDLESVWLPEAEITGAAPARAASPGVRRKAALAGANLAGAHLAKAILFNADLSGAAMDGAVLGGADLSGADLSGAFLFHADLSDAELTNANLSDAWMAGADLSDVIFSNTDLAEADLRDANLSGVRFLTNGSVPDADMSDVDMSSADLSDAYLPGMDFSGVNLGRAILSRADLSGVDLSNADLRGADFRGANLRGVDLRGADLLGAKNLTQEQIEDSRTDSTTKLPAEFS